MRASDNRGATAPSGMDLPANRAIRLAPIGQAREAEHDPSVRATRGPLRPLPQMAGAGEDRGGGRGLRFRQPRRFRARLEAETIREPGQEGGAVEKVVPDQAFQTEGIFQRDFRRGDEFDGGRSLVRLFPGAQTDFDAGRADGRREGEGEAARLRLGGQVHRGAVAHHGDGIGIGQGHLAPRRIAVADRGIGRVLVGPVGHDLPPQDEPDALHQILLEHQRRRAEAQARPR